MADLPTSKRPGSSLERARVKQIRCTENDILEVARKIWYRGRNAKVKCASTEDRDFCEFFCRPLSVAGEVWDMLRCKGLLLEN